MAYPYRTEKRDGAYPIDWSERRKFFRFGRLHAIVLTGDDDQLLKGIGLDGKLGPTGNPSGRNVCWQ